MDTNPSNWMRFALPTLLIGLAFTRHTITLPMGDTHPGVESFNFWMVAGDPKNLDLSEAKEEPSYFVAKS